MATPGRMTQPGGTMTPGGTTTPGRMTQPGGTMAPGGMTTPGGMMQPGGTMQPSGMRPSQGMTFDNFGGMDDMGDMFNMDGIDQDLQVLRDLFRLLWEQHVNWTRNTVSAIIHDLPETQLIINRLLRNPKDFADALMQFYGQEAANEFDQLLTSHLTIAAEIVKAAKAGDQNAVTEANQRWHDNADQIAKLLGSINPYWDTDDWSAMMNEHLNLLFDNSAQMIAGKYEDSINGFDDIEAQALEMGDVMAEGIIMQFSEL
jgi:hypothetical protein